MARSQETFGKKEVRNKKAKKRKDKEAKRLARKEIQKSSELEDMMAYVDEFGNITDTPPDPTKKREEIKADNIVITVPKKETLPVQDTVRKGIVTFFNDAKGFGFIKDSETQQSVFVHINNVNGEIKDHNAVLFEVEMGPKGPNALNVKVNK